MQVEVLSGQPCIWICIWGTLADMCIWRYVHLEGIRVQVVAEAMRVTEVAQSGNKARSGTRASDRAILKPVLKHQVEEVEPAKEAKERQPEVWEEAKEMGQYLVYGASTSL